MMEHENIINKALDEKISTKVEEIHIETRSAPSDDELSATESHHGIVHVTGETEDGIKIDISWRSWVVMTITTIALIAQIFGSTAAGANIVFIVRDLGDQALGGWLIISPLLMQCIFSPVVGRFSDVLDRKWVVTIPPLLGFIGSIVCAKASSMTILIGGGLLLGSSLPTAAVVHAIQAEILPKRMRAIASAFAFVGAGLGGFGAGLGGSYMVSTGPSGWRYLFWIQSAFHATAFLGFLFFYWPSRRSDYPKMSWGQYFWMCDPIGSFFFISGSCLTLISLNWAGGKYEWRDPHIFVMLIFGGLLLVSFGLYEWKGRTDGLVPHIIFKNGPNFPIAWLGMSIEGWIMYGGLMQLTSQSVINLGFENNAWKTSLRGLAFMVPGIIFTVIISVYATRYKDMIGPLYVTWPVFIAAVICFATLSPYQSHLQIVYSVLGGIGQSGPMALLVPIIQFAAPHAYLSTASGIAYSGRSIGGAFGTAVLAYMSNHYIFKHYNPEVSARALAAGLPSDSIPALLKALKARVMMEALNEVPAMTPAILKDVLDESHWVYARAYRQAWWSLLPFVIICFISLFFLRDVKHLMTAQVEATVEQVDKQREKQQNQQA